MPSQHQVTISRPVILSRIAADRALASWLEQNESRRIRDKSGAFWQLHSRLEMKPAPQSLGSPTEWLLYTYLDLNFEVNQLVSWGCLDAEKDKRLIELASEASLRIHSREKLFRSYQFESLKEEWISYLEKLKSYWARQDWFELKQAACARWVDEKMAWPDINSDNEFAKP